MERVMCSSPSKNSFIHESLNCPKSPTTYSTPVRQSDKKRQNAFSNSMAGFNVLPTHITPPSGLTKFIARNPFDADLTSRLHLSVISPTVFSKVSPAQNHDSPGFSWSVDELALIHPAKIEEFPTQQMHTTDPDIEVVAQAAINKFFTATQIIPSPWDARRKGPAGKSEMHTPSRPLEDLNITRENHKNQKDCWTQTVLTLPPVLPSEVEEALKPYFTFNQDQNVESEDANSSNNSLRRKLFFNHEDCTDDEEETSFSVSPIESRGSSIPPSSPPQSGMFVHGTPLRGGSLSLQRTHGTPCARSLSPPNMSPISTHDMSCQSIRSRCQLAARLDFTTEMSIDTSARDDKELKRLEDVDFAANTSVLRANLLSDEPETDFEDLRGHFAKDGDDLQNETAAMFSRETTPLKNEELHGSIIFPRKGRDILEDLKISSDSSKTNGDESYSPQNITILGNSCVGQQSYVNSCQDTGYQTSSMSNITGNTDNCSIGPITKSFNWNEKKSSNGDDVRLSDWQDNMKIMFSSTPSKFSRRRED